jgi:hypothetical protein
MIETHRVVWVIPARLRTPRPRTEGRWNRSSLAAPSAVGEAVCQALGGQRGIRRPRQAAQGTRRTAPAAALDAMEQRAG